MSVLSKIPLLSNVLVLGYRIVIGFRYLINRVRLVLRWLLYSRETTNFTYDLTANNIAHLTSFIANVTGKSYAEIDGYIREISHDQSLKDHIVSITKKSGQLYKSDRYVCYSRRIGWYAFVRALRPKIVIETGVDKGLGSCIITAALLRNQADGNYGYYYGTDINPQAGFLLQAPYSRMGKILYGDSITSLENFEQRVDLFINDSDHSAEYEAKEYELILSKLSPNAYILGDNCHVTPKLLEFALYHDKQFAFFREEPSNHWYAGAGIGVAYDKKLL